MAWEPMHDVLQWVDANSTVASGYVLKAYLPGTTTATSMAIDKDGGSLQSTITLNAEGKPEVSSVEVIPYIDRTYKWALFQNATDASNNSNPFAGFYDNVPLIAEIANLTDSGRPVVDYSDQDVTLSTATIGNYARMDGTTAMLVNVPTNASDAIPIGAEFHIRHVGSSSTVVVTPESGVTVNTPNGGTTTIATSGGTVTVKKVATNEWDLFGQVVSA